MLKGKLGIDLWSLYMEISNLKVKIIGISGEEIVCANLNGVIKGDYDCGKQFSTNNFFDLYTRKVISSNKKTECCQKQSLIQNIDSCKIDTNQNPNHSKYLKISHLFILLFLFLF